MHCIKIQRNSFSRLSKHIIHRTIFWLVCVQNVQLLLVGATFIQQQKTFVSGHLFAFDLNVPSNYRSSQSSPWDHSKNNNRYHQARPLFASAKDDATMPPEIWSTESPLRQESLQKCFIPLSSTSHKGSSGRVGVLGGSARYTGAPYYAAMASLKAGADLAFVFCAEEAAIPIKCYSPELMVAPVYNAAQFDRFVKDGDQTSDQAEALIETMVEEVTEIMDKLHVLVIGPGLGRCPIVLEATSRIIVEARSRKLPMVLDADALFLLTLESYRRTLHHPSNDAVNVPVVLTPNAIELKRLKDFLAENGSNDCIVVEKGSQDIVRRGGEGDGGAETSLVCGEKGGLKRPGGLGDVLAGTLGSLVAWNAILTKRAVASIDDLPLSCWTGCCIVKRATRQAFEEHRRSMTAPDVLMTLGSVVNEMTGDLDGDDPGAGKTG